MTITPAISLVTVSNFPELHAKAALKRFGHLDMQRYFGHRDFTFHRARDQGTPDTEHLFSAGGHRLDDDHAGRAVRTADAPHRHEIAGTCGRFHGHLPKGPGDLRSGSSGN